MFLLNMCVSFNLRTINHALETLNWPMILYFKVQFIVNVLSMDIAKMRHRLVRMCYLSPTIFSLLV